MSSAMARNILRMFSACCCSWVRVLNLLSLVTPSTSLRDVRAEAFLDVGDGVLGVLGDVVQEGSRDRHRVQAELGKDAGHRQRVADVRLAAGSLFWSAWAS